MQNRFVAAARRLPGKPAWIFLTTILVFAFAGKAVPSVAAVQEGEGVLCTVDRQLADPSSCNGEGPASQRGEYWEEGLLPRRALPVMPIDPALAEMDRGYARASGEVELGFYLSVEDAVGGNRAKWVFKGFVYVSIVEVIEREEGRFYRNAHGYIIRGDEVRPISFKGQFSGVTILENPVHPFGWIIPYEGVYPSRTPGGPEDSLATYYPRYSVAEIFGTQQTNSGVWYMVGINQWIAQKKIGLVYPNVARPPEIPPGVKWIGIDLFEQSLTAYEGDRMVFATLIAGGLPGTWTRPGVFHVKKKLETDTMAGGDPNKDPSTYYYVEDVPWVMYFDDGRAIHGNYWHNNMGAPHSHGCVNVTVADGHWLYDWAPQDTWVYVYDPSGKTPTDDASYKGDAGVI